MSRLYRVDIIETREDVGPPSWTIRYSWAISEPVPYEGDWEAGRYETTLTPTGEPRTYTVIAEDAEVAKAVAQALVQHFRTLTQSVPWARVVRDEREQEHQLTPLEEEGRSR